MGILVTGGGGALKRISDLFISISLLLCFSPIICIVAVLVKIKLGSPIIFKQLRPGLNKVPFNIYKFRTMTNKRDSEGQLLPDDIRLTSFGRFLRKYSLDELVQLVNVVKGELSIVGPRPLLMEYLPLYNSEQSIRHQVKPGITGWAQVNGRNAITWEEKFKLDVWYVDHRSLLLDMKILFLTVIKVIRSEGINQPRNATMERFTGSNSTFGGRHG
jgi:sugar transferase EpsL